MTRRSLLIMVWLFLALPAIRSTAQGATTLLLPDVTIRLGQTTTVDVILACPASNCIGIDATISYDSDVIEITGVNPGDYLGDSPRVLSSEVEDEGTLRFSALAAERTPRPAEGVIFRIDLVGTALDETDLRVTSLTIFRRGGTVQAAAENGVIHVSETATSPETLEQVTVRLTRRLTLRSGPGPEYELIGTADPNTDLQVVGVSDDGTWFLVELPDSLQGWLAGSRFMTFSGNIDALPVASMTAEIQPPTEAPEATEPFIPTDTPTSTEAPTATEALETLPPAADTATPSPEPLPSNTPEPTLTSLPTEAPETEAPTATIVPPTARPTDTPPPTRTAEATVPATATLRTDSSAPIAPPATETSPAIPTATATPTETALPTATLTPSATATPLPTNTPTPCTISTALAGIPVSVGPNRVVRTTLPINVEIRVTGQQTADDGSLWWRIEPLNQSVEADRFWVRQSDVTAHGDCDLVENADSPDVISGGSGGNQFSGSFRAGQNSNSHTFSISASGSYQIVCSGSPTYPEFGVGSTRSRGQTTIVLNLTPGTYTLTVSGSTFSRAGQPVAITSYECRLSRT